MKNVIITLAGLMILGTSALVADGSTIDLTETAVASEVQDSTLVDSTVGIDIKTNDSTVSLTNTAVASTVHDSELANSTVGITIDDTGAEAEEVLAPVPTTPAASGVTATVNNK